MTTIHGRTPAELARLQVELEYAVGPDGLLVPLPADEEQPRCCLYLHARGCEAFFCRDVPVEARRAVASLAMDDVLASPAALAAPLGGGTAERYETYVAAAPFPASSHPDAVPDGEGAFVVTGPDGRAVSRAWSVRESARAAECAVETDEPFRRRGLGTQVTAAWSNAVLATGKVPFYSHEAANEPSRALAVHLGLTHVFTVITVE